MLCGERVQALDFDPEGGSGEGPADGIPPSNPFADGAEGAPETWLYGVRNPWRFTFDSATGDLWVADVGQDAFEEIDRLLAAAAARPVIERRIAMLEGDRIRTA